MSIREFLEGPYMEKDGVAYAADVPPDVHPSRDPEPQNKARWSYWRKRNYEFFKREISALPDGSVVLDIGAGQGDFRDIFARTTLCAVDFYPYEGINVVCDFNRRLPFRDSIADALVLSNVLEHIAEPGVLLAECQRVLKPGGALLLSVPFMAKVHQRPYDFYRYTDINLAYLMEKYGFGSTSIEPVLALRVLLFNTLTDLFVALIERTRFSRFSVLQALVRFVLRAAWKFVRVSLRIFDPLLARVAEDPDAALGYQLKAQRS